MPDRLLTFQEVAEWLQVPPGTLYGWCYRGDGPPSYKVGRYVRYRLGEVEAWLERVKAIPKERSR